MKDLKDFDISFIGINEGTHQFEYLIKKEFFEFFNYDEFSNSKVVVALTFVKKATMFELSFNFNGWVEVLCDVSGEVFQQPLNSTMNLIVKFGDEFSDENEEMLIIPHSDYKLNVSQFIYEAIILAVPIKRIHPGVSDGSLNSEVLNKLKEFEIKDQDDSNEEIDPRWNKLKNILIEKNKSNGTS